MTVVIALLAVLVGLELVKLAAKPAAAFMHRVVANIRADFSAPRHAPTLRRIK